MSDSMSIMEFGRTHQAFRERWANTDDKLCRHSMSFDLHNTLRQEFFASYLYMLEQIPLVKLYAATCANIKGKRQFYYRAQNFYKDVPASEQGMMGEFVEFSELDLDGSRQFLKKFVGPGKAGNKRALDCGCGIGRVSKGVLLPILQTLDMLDMMENFIVHAHECYLGDHANRVETYYVYNLQDFTPTPQRYDVIWMQWVACHLTDKDLMDFLGRAQASLRPHGVIILKDNMARQGCRLDTTDSSVIRHLDVMKNIIEKAGLTVLDVQKQDGFPESTVPMWMIAMH